MTGTERDDSAQIHGTTSSNVAVKWGPTCAEEARERAAAAIGSTHPSDAAAAIGYRVRASQKVLKLFESYYEQAEVVGLNSDMASLARVGTYLPNVDWYKLNAFSNEGVANLQYCP